MDRELPWIGGPEQLPHGKPRTPPLPQAGGGTLNGTHEVSRTPSGSRRGAVDRSPRA
jgi:hypothetical protein